jgi:cell division protein FtsB
MNSKDLLLDEVGKVLAPLKKLDISYLVYTLVVLFFVLAVLFPKIYITQQIYFKSREISKLKAEYDTLKEENKVIGASVEEIKYKNQVIDTIF